MLKMKCIKIIEINKASLNLRTHKMTVSNHQNKTSNEIKNAFLKYANLN